MSDELNGSEPSDAPLVFVRHRGTLEGSLRDQISGAASDWLARTPSPHTRDAYVRDLHQFLGFASVPPGQLEELTRIRPGDVAAWRDLSPGASKRFFRRLDKDDADMVRE